MCKLEIFIKIEWHPTNLSDVHFQIHLINGNMIVCGFLHHPFHSPENHLASFLMRGLAHWMRETEQARHCGSHPESSSMFLSLTWVWEKNSINKTQKVGMFRTLLKQAVSGIDFHVKENTALQTQTAFVQKCQWKKGWKANKNKGLLKIMYLLNCSFALKCAFF